VRKPGEGHNSDLELEKQLRGISSRIERLNEEISGLNAEKSDAYQEAKRLGFAPDALRAAIAYRKDPDRASEKIAGMDRILEVLGRFPASGTDLAKRVVHARGGDADE
jgi:uncharacterized protein (UPF0335 family)